MAETGIAETGREIEGGPLTTADHRATVAAEVGALSVNPLNLVGLRGESETEIATKNVGAPLSSLPNLDLTAKMSVTQKACHHRHSGAVLIGNVPEKVEEGAVVVVAVGTGGKVGRGGEAAERMERSEIVVRTSKGVTQRIRTSIFRQMKIASIFQCD